MSKMAASKDQIELFQAKYHSDDDCKRMLKDCEKRYKFVDETELFSNLVNFSTAKMQPYQRWVKYREGYSVILVRELIERSGIHTEESFVADPMMGSGSTLVAAKEKGYDALGIDINPYCQMITELKMANPSSDVIHTIREFMLDEKWQTYDVETEELPPLADFFPKDNLVEILKIKKWIETIEDDRVKQIIRAAWFFCLENVSNRKKDGNGLSTRPAPVDHVSEYFRDLVEDILYDFETYPMNATNSYVRTESAFCFASCVREFEKQIGKKLGCVIFSPPYANSFDYFESYKLELLFGGLMEQKDFTQNKKGLIRNYRISYKQELTCDIAIVEALCREIWKEIPKKEAKTGKKDSRTRLMPNMIRGYFIDMRQVLRQIYEALEEDKDCYIVVDQSAYVGVIIPTDVILALLAEQIGFKVSKISICRHTSTSGQQLKEYPYLKNTLRESIVCLKK